MKLYLSHASGYDYQAELYEPLKAGLPAALEVFYPHDPENNGKHSKEIIETSDVVLAEVSRASTGQGIELGWASAANKRILAFYTQDATPSGAVTHVADDVFAYSNQTELVAALIKHLG